MSLSLTLKKVKSTRNQLAMAKIEISTVGEIGVVVGSGTLNPLLCKS